MKSDDPVAAEKLLKLSYYLRLPSVVQETEGWWSETHPSLRAHDMLFGEGDNFVDINIHNHYQPSFLVERHRVFPLNKIFSNEGFLASYGSLEEMVLWHFLTFDASFQVKNFLFRDGYGYTITRHNEYKARWSPGDRRVLVQLFQLAGILSSTSLEEFSETYGYKGREDSLLVKSFR